MAVDIKQLGDITKFRMARNILGKPFYWTTSYLVDGLLIDTGPRHTVNEFVTALQGHRINTVVNTHSHEDHVAGNRRIKEIFNPRLLAHEKALAHLEDPGGMDLHPYQLIMWGRPEPSVAEPLGKELETDRYKFEILETPGHGEDHICLFERNMGWLFTGDIFVGGKDKTLRKDFNVWRIIESLKFLVSFEPEWIFPGSGNEKSGATDELRKKIDYLEGEGQKIFDLHKKGVAPKEIRKRLFGPEMAIKHFTLGHYSGMNLVNSFLYHRPDREN
jgi:glyoxylase-like metal-dependent hydrolase (beta-lactamase superfamily II)